METVNVCKDCCSPIETMWLKNEEDLSYCYNCGFETEGVEMEIDDYYKEREERFG